MFIIDDTGSSGHGTDECGKRRLKRGAGERKERSEEERQTAEVERDRDDADAEGQRGLGRRGDGCPDGD